MFDLLLKPIIASLDIWACLNLSVKTVFGQNKLQLQRSDLVWIFACFFSFMTVGRIDTVEDKNDYASSVTVHRARDSSSYYEGSVLSYPPT